MDSDALVELVTAAVDDLKGQDVQVLDVRELTTITDYMVIVSGTSDRHLKALAEEVVDRVKEAGLKPAGVEGQGGEWILVDLLDVIVHLMRPSARDFFALERLWSQGPGAPDAADA